MASGIFAKGIEAFGIALFDWTNASATVKAMLAATGISPDFDLHDFLNDLVSSRVTGTTDQTIGSKAITFVAGSNQVHFDGPATITYTAVPGTVTCVGCLIYFEPAASPTDANRRLLCYNEFSASVVSNGSDIQVTFAADGHMRFTY